MHMDSLHPWIELCSSTHIFYNGRPASVRTCEASSPVCVQFAVYVACKMMWVTVTRSQVINRNLLECAPFPSNIQQMLWLPRLMKLAVNTLPVLMLLGFSYSGRWRILARLYKVLIEMCSLALIY